MLAHDWTSAGRVVVVGVLDVVDADMIDVVVLLVDVEMVFVTVDDVVLAVIDVDVIVAVDVEVETAVVEAARVEEEAVEGVPVELIDVTVAGPIVTVMGTVVVVNAIWHASPMNWVGQSQLKVLVVGHVIATHAAVLLNKKNPSEVVV
jgi:hypothetical protein